MGYITKGRGVSVHRVDCPNVQKSEENGERLVEVYWNTDGNAKNQYSANLEVQGYNRNGLLNEVLKTVNNSTKSLTSINGKVDHNRMVTISISLGVRNLEHLNLIMDHIRNVRDIYVVKRPFR